MNILSIQSHVAYGHAGNSSAIFPLQRMGVEVWPVHTVMFSNHTGHGAWRGPVIAADTVRDVITGIEERGVLPNCNAVLSGYMGSADIGDVILEAVEKVKAANSEAIYCCDPVIGDYGRGVFVREGIPEFFRDNVITHADILTPNQFELELLTGQTVTDLDSALSAAHALRETGADIILVTSLERENTDPTKIEMMAVSSEGAWLVETPKLVFPIPLNGSGDATTALFLAHYLKHRNVRSALEHIAGAIYALFETTWRAESRELMLITAQDFLVSPPKTFTAVSVSDIR